jgi:hypothetical protein
MFDWSEYLDFAKKIICCDDNGGIIDEAACRASISRAYYAAFCLSRNYLRDVDNDYLIRFAYNGNKDAQETMGSIHRYVIDKYLESNDEDRVNIGLVLDNLKSRRVYADYKDHHDSRLMIKVQESLEFAQEIIEELQKNP